MTTATDEKIHRPSQLDDRSYALHFRVRREMLYDEWRAAFFERWVAVALVFGVFSNAALTVSLWSGAPIWLSTGLGFVSVTFLAVTAAARPAVQAAEHRVGQHGFLRLADALAPLRNFDDVEYAALLQEYHALLSDVSSTKVLLAMQCHDAALQHYGGCGKQIPHYDFWRRWSANFISWRNYARTIQRSQLGMLK